MFTDIRNESSPHRWSFMLEPHGGAGSGVADISPSATSFFHRDKRLLYQFATSRNRSQDFEEDFPMLESFRESITSSMVKGDWGMYANYIDTQVDGDTAERLYWGDNLPRLRAIKAQLDPNQVFWNPQGVTPEPKDSTVHG